MLRSHRRKTVLTAAALMATTALLTSCQGGDSDGKKSSGSGSSASDSDAKGKSDEDKGGADGTEAQSGSGSGGESGGKGGGKAVTGTWFGNVSYLAPGKYTVTDMKDTEQAFFTSTDTDIQGAGKICGDAEGQAATPCTEDQLEAASKKGVSATVKIKNGTAVSIVEDHSSSSGGSDGGENTSGTWSGDLGYMAPGKYTVQGEEGTKRAFFTSTETVINGAGWICGDRTNITPCTEDQLEAAAKKGIAVVIKVNKGIAVTIDEEHN